MLKIGSNISEVRIDGNLKSLRLDLDAFLACGLTAAEIPVHGVDAIKNGRLDRKQALEVRRILEDYPFSYSVHAPNPLNLMDRDNLDMHIAVLDASLQFCLEIGSTLLVYHPGRYLAEEEFAVKGPIMLSDTQKKRLLEQEAAILQNYAGQYQLVTIALENARPYRFHSPYCYAEIPAELKKQVRRIARDNVRVTLDFGHLWMAAKFYGFDPLTEITALARLIAHCHVHDNFGASVFASEKQQTHQIPFGRGDSHMPVGWGDIPFPELFLPFLEQFEGLLIAELRGRYFAHTRESATTLATMVSSLTGRTTQQLLTVNI
ncbi:MAG: sugar phosphate isomerase/epimerase [Desulfuromonadales bacterium]|nr:sugar phosphate isomerase/epimerase [Desulfuromonadales bacterium]